jgi:general L-amino acid transport system substrate-binding protein
MKKIGDLNMTRKSGISRRRFLGTSAAAGVAGAMMGSGVAHAKPPAPPPTGILLDDVKARGVLRVVLAPEEFVGLVEFQGAKPRGFEPDLGRALAAAIFDVSDPHKIDKYIEFVIPAGWDERMTEITDGKADVGFALNTYTTSRDTLMGVDFGPTSYYDGQQIWTTAANVAGITKLGYIAATTGEAVAPTLLPSDKIKSFASSADMVAAYKSGEIDAMITDASGNIANAISFGLDGSHLPEVYSKEFLSTFTAENQPEFMDVLREVMHALIEAERQGITKANVGTVMGDKEYYLGRGLGPKLGLSETWAESAVKMNGNYGEIFEKNLTHDAWYQDPGTNTDRGLNNLWINGGLHYQGAFR